MLTNVNCAMGSRYYMATFSLMICICMVTFNISAGEDTAVPASGSNKAPVGQVETPAVAADAASGGKKADKTSQSAQNAQQTSAQRSAGEPPAAPAPAEKSPPAPTEQPIVGKPAAQSGAGAGQPDNAAAPGKDNAPKTPGSAGVSQTVDDVESSGHFMGYFIATAVACVALYLMYHNRHKMLAFIVEGRRGAAGRRRVVTTSGSAEYRQLSNAEEGTPSDIGGGVAASSRSEPPKGYVY